MNYPGDETESKSGRISTVETEKRAKQRKNKDGKLVETNEGNVITEDSVRKSERRRQREERKKRHDEKDSEKQKTEFLKSEEPVFDIWSSIFGFIAPVAEPVMVPSPSRRSKRESSERRKEKSRNHRSKKDKFDNDNEEKSPRFPDSYSQLDNEPQTTSEESKPETPVFAVHSSRIFSRINSDDTDTKDSNTPQRNGETSPSFEEINTSCDPAALNESISTTNILAVPTLPPTSTITPASFIAKSRRRASALLFRASSNQLDEAPPEDPPEQQTDKVAIEPVNGPQREDISPSRRLSSNAASFPWFLPFGRTISDPAPPSSRNEAISREPATSLKSSVGLKPMESNDTSQNETISLLKANLNVLRTQHPDVVRNPSNSSTLNSDPTAMYSTSRLSKPNLTTRQYYPTMRCTPSTAASLSSLLTDCSSAEVASLLGDGLSCGFCQSVQVSLPRKLPSISSSTGPQRSVLSGADIVPIQTLLRKPCRIQIVSRPAKGSSTQPVLLIELALRSSSSKLCTLTYAIPEDICDVRAGLDDESANLNGNPDPINRTGESFSSILRRVGSSSPSSSSSSWSNLEKQAGQFGLTICCREPNPDVSLVFPSLSVRDDVLQALADILRMFSPYGC